MNQGILSAIYSGSVAITALVLSYALPSPSEVSLESRGLAFRIEAQAQARQKMLQVQRLAIGCLRDGNDPDDCVIQAVEGCQGPGMNQSQCLKPIREWIDEAAGEHAAPELARAI